MSYTSELAEYFATMKLEDLPLEASRMARVCLLDTLGVIFAGHAFLDGEGDQRLQRYLAMQEGAEQATALGSHRRTW